MIAVTLLLVLFTSTALAGEVKYWEIEIPVPEGSENVTRERDDKSYVISVSFKVELKDTKGIHGFYREYFEAMNWEDPYKKHRKVKNEFRGEWSSYSSTYNEAGLPESSYAGLWNAKNLPATGTVSVNLTSFNGESFSANVHVSIAPEVDTSPLFKLQELMMGDPKNIFILHEATGGNPFELDKVNPEPLGKYRNNEVVKGYYDLIERIIQQYKDFGAKYVHK